MKRTLIFFLTVLFAVSCTKPPASSVPAAQKTAAQPATVPGTEGNKPGTYHTHEEIIAMYKQLSDQHKKVSSYKSIGKTTTNNDIWAFTFGNPNGGKVILDGCLHGWEDLGSEVTYVWIKWLLESNDAAAKKILAENCWIVIPVINFDTYDRGNNNHTVCKGGIDLNRNFMRGWEYVTECNGDYGTSHGESAGSEKETQVIRAFMDANRPGAGEKAVYINTHYGGGPWIHYDGKDLAEYWTPLRDRIISLWNQNGIILKNVKLEQYLPPVSRSASKGGEIGDATDFGYKGITVEMMNQNCVNGHKFAPLDETCVGGKGEARDLTYDGMVNNLYPIFKQFFLAVSESVAKTGK